VNREAPQGRGAGEASRLAVSVDGTPMAGDAARDVWQRFSAYMEEHKGDLAGFAKAEGYLSVHPRSEGGRAVLVFSRTEPQEAYGVVPARAESKPSPTQTQRSGPGPHAKRRKKR
jgi:hypothetical protein